MLCCAPYKHNRAGSETSCAATADASSASAAQSESFLGRKDRGLMIANALAPSVNPT